MAERGNRTRLSWGGVVAEVSLLKTSGDPREARHDVRRGDDPSPAQKKREADALAGADGPDGELAEMVAESAEDPLTGEPAFAPGGLIPRGPTLGGVLPEEEVEDHTVEKKEPEVQQGVWRGEEWVDLTERFAEVDKACKLEDMEVVMTLPSASIPRSRVRGACWVAVADPKSSKVLALIWQGLAGTGRVAIVRWTVRTKQALGALVPQAQGANRQVQKALLLLDLEWAQNMREPDPRVTEPLDVEVANAEIRAAHRLADAYAGKQRGLDDLRDEREVKRAELLAAARDDRLDDYEPPAPPEEVAEQDVAEAWEAATNG